MKKIYLLLIFYCISFSTSYAAATLVLSGGSPTTANTICQGASQVVIYTYTVTAGSTANGITNFSFTTTGSAISGTDITDFAVWTSSVSATFSPATAVQLGGTLTTGLGAGTHVNTAFTSVPLKVSSANYIFITANISPTATPGNTIKVDGYAAAAATYTVAISATVPLTNTSGSTPTGSTAASGVFTITAPPAAITSLSAICAGGSTITLSDATTGGTWSSGTITVATIGSATGLVTSGIVGTSTITYSNGCGTAATATVSVLGVPGAISGSTAVCYGGGTTNLSDAVAGGTWSSSSAAVATVGLTTGLVTGGVAAGTATITYSTGCGAAATTTVTSQAPLPPPAPITGATALCQTSTLVLSDATSGGVWSSSNTSVATVTPSSGVVRGVAPGTSIITYTSGNSCGSLSTVSTVTVNALPTPAAITGNTTVCGVSTLSDATSGGVWTSNNTSVATVDATGTVHGVAIGTATISYTITNGCGTVFVTTLVTINPLPSPSPITGSSNVCTGGTMTLYDVAPGGVWSSSNTAVATVVPGTGAVYGVTAGSVMISYTISNSCGSAFTTTTVNAILPGIVPAAIAGVANVCVGSTITLSDATAGGVWSRSPASSGIATISSSGVVTGISAGSTTISYSVTNSCGTAFVTAPLSIVSFPVAGTITGSGSVCLGTTTTLADGISGGVWSSAIPFYATVSGTGVVTGVNQGLATISYTVTNSCGSASADFTVNVLPSASPQCYPASVNMVNASTGLKVFPNPNEGTFSMEMLSAIADEPVQVIITNIIGEKVKEFIITTNKVVNVNLDQASGIYLLSASDSHDKYVTKIIVQ